MNPIQELLKVRRDIAALEATELALMQDIIDLAKHKVIGQKTYEMFGSKVEIVTKETPTLDTALLNQVWTDALPINRSFAYTLRKKDFDAAMVHGSPELRSQLSAIVTTKPAKPVVRVKD